MLRLNQVSALLGESAEGIREMKKTVDIRVADLRKIVQGLYSSKQTNANDAIYIKMRDLLDSLHSDASGKIAK